jgi:hypothetical protein
MDPHNLIDPTTTTVYPAPAWFILLFKMLGFVLHAAFMNLWLAGTTLAVILRSFGGEHSRRVSDRLMRQMPIIVAFGVNLGIVPLLFVQVAYYKVFYPATILMAWPWLSIIVLLTLAYYGVYLYASGLREGGEGLTAVRRAAGWIAAVLFITIGFLFANGFSLMTNVGRWPQIWQSTSVAGAPLGIALNTGDPTLWPRWLMMFGLALTTTGAYIAFDAAYLAGAEGDAYRRQAPRTALTVYSLGALWFAAFGSWYVFGTWSNAIRDHMFRPPMIVLTLITAASPAIVWLLLLLQRGGTTRTMAFFTAIGQFLVLVFNAGSRQHVQNAELRGYLEPFNEPVQTQLSPLIVFLVLFVAGLGLVLWMLSKAAGRPTQASPAQ